MIMETSGSGVEVLSKLKSALTINRTGFCGAVVHTSLRSLKLEILRKNSNLGNDLEAIIVKEQRDGLYGRNVIDYLKEHPEIELVRFVLFGTDAYNAYKTVAGKINYPAN